MPSAPSPRPAWPLALSWSLRLCKQAHTLPLKTPGPQAELLPPQPPAPPRGSSLPAGNSSCVFIRGTHLRKGSMCLFCDVRRDQTLQIPFHSNSPLLSSTRKSDPFPSTAQHARTSEAGSLSAPPTLPWTALLPGDPAGTPRAGGRAGPPPGDLRCWRLARASRNCPALLGWPWTPGSHPQSGTDRKLSERRQRLHTHSASCPPASHSGTATRTRRQSASLCSEEGRHLRPDRWVPAR